VDAGKFRVLTIYSDARLKRWPNVPTAKELGYNVVESVPWGLVGPAGMKPEVVQTLYGAFHKALSDPGYLKTLQLLGQEPWDADPQAWRNYMLSRIPVERDIVERFKLKERA
jgi:tripartite-type tricarboxylate transporter receptor subunit TctC